MRRSQLLILGDPEVHYAASFLTSILDSQLTSHRLGPLSGRFVLRGVRPNSINFAIYAYIPSPLAENVITRANTKSDNLEKATFHWGD